MGDTWFGTPGSDAMIWRGGDDDVIGLQGQDTLVMRLSRDDVRIGSYSQGILQIAVLNQDYKPGDPADSGNPRFKAVITAVDIDRLKFFDKTINIKKFIDNRKAARQEQAQRRQNVAAKPRADAALARLPMTVDVFRGDGDPAAIAAAAPFSSPATFLA